MTLRMGNQLFVDVQVPLLWGDRAVLQDSRGRLSLVDLGADKARVELLADEPAPGVDFRPEVDGYIILDGEVEIYSYSPSEKRLTSLSLGLPEVQITRGGTRIGSNWFSGNVMAGAAVGIAVRKDGIAMGTQLPAGLAQLRVA